MPNLTVIENRNPVRSEYCALLTPTRFDGRTLEIDRGFGRELTFKAGGGLSIDERRRADAKAHDLAMLLEPGPPQSIAAEIAFIATVMPSKDHGEEADVLWHRAAGDALAGQPLFAVVEMREDFFKGLCVINGKALDPHWRPAPPELAILTRERALPYLREAARVAAFLGAREEKAAAEDPAKRDAILEKVNRFTGKTPDLGDKARRQDVEADRSKALAELASSPDWPADVEPPSAA